MDYFVQEALKEAYKSDIKSKYGALVIYKGKIISRGHNYHNLRMFNCCKSFEGYTQNKFSVHAEQSAINNCIDKNILQKCRIILVKIKTRSFNTEDNEILKKCKPCNKCEKILKKYKIKDVTCYYNTVDENYKKQYFDKKTLIEKEEMNLNYSITVQMKPVRL